MAGKRILTARVTVNMIAADDIYTADEQLLIPADTVITQDILGALKDHSIFAVRVKVGSDGKTPILAGQETPEGGKDGGENLGAQEEDNSSEMPDLQQTPPENEGRYYENVRETKEFKEFNQAFIESVDHLKDTFNRVVMRNEEINADVVLMDVENVVSKSRNCLNIMDMLQCIHGYDDVTYVHSLNVALLSNMIGKIVFPNISKRDLDVLTLSAVLHDIGKIMVPDDILQKEGTLSISEYNVIKTHVLHGNTILKNMKEIDPQVAEVAMRHHERCDGSGYPGGFTENQISPFAKIVAIADTYDAMTSDRVYRKAICPFDVIHMFEREGLVKYEVEYLLPFLATAVQAYMNTDVYLTTNEVGRVVMINTQEFSRPIVKVGNMYYDLTKERSISIDRIID